VHDFLLTLDQRRGGFALIDATMREFERVLSSYLVQKASQYCRDKASCSRVAYCLFENNFGSFDDMGINYGATIILP